MSTTLLPADTAAVPSTDLELDEVWSFVGSKRNPVSVWVALCRATRQIVALVTGNRSAATCWRLWIAIPLAYRRGICYTDFWQAYQAVLPDDQHVPSGKETGYTAHIERWNNTLRQRLGRFVRKTLSFSKCPIMHWICLQFFIHRYNLMIAIRRG